MILDHAYTFTYIQRKSPRYILVARMNKCYSKKSLMTRMQYTKTFNKWKDSVPQNICKFCSPETGQQGNTSHVIGLPQSQFFFFLGGVGVFHVVLMHLLHLQAHTERKGAAMVENHCS